MLLHAPRKTRHAVKARTRKRNVPSVPVTGLDEMPFHDFLADEDAWDDYDYSIDEHAAVDEARTHGDFEPQSSD